MPHTFVLVPGCWVGGWAWHPVARELTARGHRVVVPEIPGMSFGDDPRAVSLSDAVSALAAQLDRHDVTDAVLVAHDWSGYPATAATHQVRDRVAQLTYWSAFVPAAGESMLDAMPAADKAMLLERSEATDGASVLLPFERWRNRFVQTAPPRVQELTYSLLRPQPIAYLADPLPAEQATIPADLPIAYLAGTNDLSLEFGDEWWTPKYSDRAGVQPVRFEGCHASHLTHPTTVADQLLATTIAATDARN
ncbi:alpha/beta fold hydrolase [Pseudonocardia spinosispora]|uniref:alpha/beta fold hydrolase n=1 Tax=Pseudonocardia spinosispora TaxID=103441 RepID=UPI0006872907|nr:alpha/beta hydrolase [Pseudonocardia spinosispora]